MESVIYDLLCTKRKISNKRGKKHSIQEAAQPPPTQTYTSPCLLTVSTLNGHCQLNSICYTDDEQKNMEVMVNSLVGQNYIRIKGFFHNRILFVFLKLLWLPSFCK